MGRVRPVRPVRPKAIPRSGCDVAAVASWVREVAIVSRPFAVVDDRRHAAGGAKRDVARQADT